MSEQENQNPAQSPEAADAPPAAATPPPPATTRYSTVPLRVTTKLPDDVKECTL